MKLEILQKRYDELDSMIKNWYRLNKEKYHCKHIWQIPEYKREIVTEFDLLGIKIRAIKKRISIIGR